MFKYILLCSLLVHTIWAKPVHQHHGELTPHVLIVTPQAQLRLESLVPGAPIIQHLSPFTRYITPHEETIVYVPTSAAAAIQNAEIVARSLEAIKGKQFNPSEFSNTINSIVTSSTQALQSTAEQASNYLSSASTYVPSIGSSPSNIPSAIESFYQGAQNTISGYLQTQPQSQPQTSPQTYSQSQAQLLSVETPLTAAASAAEVALPPILSEQKLPVISAAVSLPPILSSEQKLPLLSVGTKIPSLTSLLSPALPAFSIYTNEPRHHYVVAPSASHIVDYLPGSIVLTPATTATIKARRSVTAEDKGANPIALTVARPVVYASNNDLEKEELLLKEKKEEFKRFLEANALKEQLKDEQLEPKVKEDDKLAEEEKSEKENLEKGPLDLKLAPGAANANANTDDTPQTKEA